MARREEDIRKLDLPHQDGSPWFVVRHRGGRRVTKRERENSRRKTEDGLVARDCQ